MAEQGSNPMSRHVADHLKDENKRMPARGLTREDTDKPNAGGQNALEAEQEEQPDRDPVKSGNREQG